MGEKDPHLLFISGPSRSGKTTLIERMIPKILERGVRVGTIKHAHEGCTLDHPGKDSWRHQRAGANPVAVITPNQTVLFVGTKYEFPLSQTIRQMAPSVDLILIEGYKELDGARILLTPHRGERISMNKTTCHIGVFPEELSETELQDIVEFSLTRAERTSHLEERWRKMVS